MRIRPQPAANFPVLNKGNNKGNIYPSNGYTGGMFTNLGVKT